MKFSKLEIIVRSTITVIFLLLFVFSWQLLVDFEFLTGTKAASPIQLIPVITGECEVLWDNLVVSLFRLLIGVFIGFLFGIIVGVITIRFELVNYTLGQLIRLLAPVPVIAWIPFAIMIFDSHEVEIISLVTLATFFIVYVVSVESIRTIEKSYVELSYMYSKSWYSRLFNIFIPASLSNLLTITRVSLIIAWIVLFIVEFGQTSTSASGLGFYIKTNWNMGKTEHFFAGVIFLSIAAFFIDLIVDLVARYLTRWKSRYSSHG